MTSKKRPHPLALSTQDGSHIAFNKGQKRRRRCLTIEDKIKLLDRLHAGERPVELSRKSDVSESAIRALVRSEKQLRQYAANCTPDAFRSTSYIPRNFTLEKTEQLVHGWYEEQRALGRTLTIVAICAKARELYTALKESDAAAGKPMDKQASTSEKQNIKTEQDSDGDEDEACAEQPDDELDVDKEDERDFKASKGWFIKFRKRYNLDFRSLHEAEPLDTTAANNYPATFAQTVRAGDYQSQQVFCAAQFSLAWKQMPERTFIAQHDQQRNKLSERISLLFCGNAYGDFSVKPMLIHRTLSPYCLRSCKPEDLPVFWRARPRHLQSTPKVTPAHFHEWLTQCFMPSVQDYLKMMELPSRCLLVLDAELLQQGQLPPYDDNFVQLEFLPANTAPLLQPISLGVVPLFKCTYLRRVLEYFHSCLEVQPEQSLYKVWRNFTISEAIDIIQEALEELSSSCWNGGWQQIWKEIVRDPLRSSALIYEIQRIVHVGCHLPGAGFSDMTMEDVQQHLKLASDEVESAQEVPTTKFAFDGLLEDDQSTDISCAPTNSDVDEIKSVATAKQIRKVVNGSQQRKVKIINKALTLSKELASTLGQLQNDNRDQHLKFVNDLQQLMQPYRKLKEQLLQPSVRDFFK